MFLHYNVWTLEQVAHGYFNLLVHFLIYYTESNVSTISAAINWMEQLLKTWLYWTLGTGYVNTWEMTAQNFIWTLTISCGHLVMVLFQTFIFSSFSFLFCWSTLGLFSFTLLSFVGVFVSKQLAYCNLQLEWRAKAEFGFCLVSLYNTDRARRFIRIAHL